MADNVVRIVLEDPAANRRGSSPYAASPPPPSAPASPPSDPRHNPDLDDWMGVSTPPSVPTPTPGPPLPLAPPQQPVYSEPVAPPAAADVVGAAEGNMPPPSAKEVAERALKGIEEAIGEVERMFGELGAAGTDAAKTLTDIAKKHIDEAKARETTRPDGPLEANPEAPNRAEYRRVPVDEPELFGSKEFKDHLKKNEGALSAKRCSSKATYSKAMNIKTIIMKIIS